MHSKLPYDVEPEQALKHPEVRERIEAAMKSLTEVTDTFLSSIVQSGHKIPWVVCAANVLMIAVLLFCLLIFRDL